MAFYAYGGRGVIQLPTQACNKALQRYDRTETGRLTTGHLQRRVATGKRTGGHCPAQNAFNVFLT